MDEVSEQSTYSFTAWGRRLGRRVIDFLAPPKCLVCHDAVLEPASLCLSCWAHLRLIDAPVCNVLGIPFAYDQGEGAISPAALADPPQWDRARAAVAYDEASRRIVHGLKYRDTMEAGLLMARLRARAGQPLIQEADVVIPVPLHRIRLWSRRFNQAAFLSQQISRQFGKAYRSDVLLRTKASRSQVGLSFDERRKNVAKVFHVAPEGFGHIAGRRVLLVDDVLTTGATAGSCAAVLKKAGAAHVNVNTHCLTCDLGLTLIDFRGPRASFRPINIRNIGIWLMTLADREKRRQALSRWIADFGGTCFVTAMLPVGNSRALLEDRIREWSIRVNKYFLGSRWYKPHRKADWMSGFVFFEFGDGGWHAHMILRPPKGVHPLKFLMRAPFVFCPHSGNRATWFYGNPVTPNGKIRVQIMEGPEYAFRVARYVTKEVQYRDEAMSSWRFIDQLTACRRPR